MPELKGYWNSGCARYVEPFAGSGSLFFQIQPNDAILGDLNKDLIDTYIAIKNGVEEVIEALSVLRMGKQTFLRIRKRFGEELNLSEKASHFIYLNRYCFNGLYRTNSKGKFNVPYGGGKSGQLPEAAQLREYSHLLSKVSLVNGDFEQTLKDVRKGDFVYLDPPYITSTKRTFGEYYPGSFTKNDLQRLTQQLNRIDAMGASFVLSYERCEESDSFLGDWNSRVVRVRRNIAGFKDSRKTIDEILISNI